MKNGFDDFTSRLNVAEENTSDINNMTTGIYKTQQKSSSKKMQHKIFKKYLTKDVVQTSWEKGGNRNNDD